LLSAQPLSTEPKVGYPTRRRTHKRGGEKVGTRRSERRSLQSDRGTTTIQDAVVSNIAAMAMTEVDGIDPSHGGARLPGDTSPTVGEFVGRVTGGTGRTRGISVDVGEAQAALDLTVNVFYGRPIHQVTETLRQNVIRRVENLTGLEVTEVNITVNDVTFPQQG
jgi:uncharacterized alkaline shock family protein YloU